MPRRRSITLADVVIGPVESWRIEPSAGVLVGHDAERKPSPRLSTRESASIARAAAERDEDECFRRTYIRPWPKEDG